MRHNVSFVIIKYALPIYKNIITNIFDKKLPNIRRRLLPTFVANEKTTSQGGFEFIPTAECGDDPMRCCALWLVFIPDAQRRQGLCAFTATHTSMSPVARG